MPDGQTLVTGAMSKSGPNAGQSQLIFWNAATGEKRYESAFEQGQIWNVVVSPDGRTVATFFLSKRQFSIYDAASGKHLRDIGARTLGSPVFSPDSKTLAGAVGKEIHLWDVATGEEVACLEGHASNITWVAFSPTGKHVASVANDHTMRLWDLETGEILQQVTEERRVSLVEFTPDGKSVAATAVDRNDVKGGDLTFWAVDGGAETMRVPVAAEVQGVMFTADGKSMVIAELNAAELREVATGKLVRRFGLDAAADMRSWTISPRRQHVSPWGPRAAPSHQWDLTSGILKDNQPGHRFPIRSVAVAADGRTVMTQDSGDGVRIWDPATGRVAPGCKCSEDTLFDLPFAPNGRKLPYYCRLVEENMLGLVDVESGKERSRFNLPAGERRFLATSADGSLLAVWMTNGEGVPQVGIWEAATGKKRKDIEKVPADLTALALSADGTRHNWLMRAAAILVWDVATGRVVHTFDVDKELRCPRLFVSRRTAGATPGDRAGNRGSASGRPTPAGRVMFTNIEGTGSRSAALSPDGRLVARRARCRTLASRPRSDFWKRPRDRKRCRLTGHSNGGVEHFEFALARTGLHFPMAGRSSRPAVIRPPSSGRCRIAPASAALHASPPT